VLWSFIKLPFLHTTKTLDELHSKTLKNGKMVQFFNRFATYNGSNPYKAPGILHIIPHLEFGIGAFFPVGGMQSIAKEIYRLAKSLGVEFYFNSKVEEILVDTKKVLGIRLGDQRIFSNIVVSNMDVYYTYQKLLPKFKIPKSVLTQERSSSALIFYWGINAQFPELDLHNIFFSENYKKEFTKIFDEQSVIDDPTVYVHISSKLESGDAPKGCENWFVMINVPSDKGQDWESLVKKARENIIKKLSFILKREIENLILCEEMLDPRLIDTKTFSYQGSLYGTASNNKTAAFFRHPNFSRQIENLYFVGGSVHPGGGIPLALSSAKIVDSLIDKT